MSIPHIFISKKQILNDIVEIRGSDARHISKVLRLGNNDVIKLFDEDGMNYTSVINEIRFNKIIVRIVDKKDSRKIEINITLMQSIPKLSKMDFIIQKSTELGVNKIIPVITDRTIVKLDEKQTVNKITRWKKIALEASKQCTRPNIPIIDNIIYFNDAIREISYNKLAIILEKGNTGSLKNVLAKSREIKDILVFIGPEGGFTEQEVQKCVQCNAIPVNLGERILRLETAVISALSIIFYEYGNI